MHSVSVQTCSHTHTCCWPRYEKESEREGDLFLYKPAWQPNTCTHKMSLCQRALTRRVSDLVETSSSQPDTVLTTPTVNWPLHTVSQIVRRVPRPHVGEPNNKLHRIWPPPRVWYVHVDVPVWPTALGSINWTLAFVFPLLLHSLFPLFSSLYPPWTRSLYSDSLDLFFGGVCIHNPVPSDFFLLTFSFFTSPL